MLLDYKIGHEIRHTCILRTQKMGATSNGGVFARGVLQDNSGTLNFICFKKEAVDFLKAEPPPVLLVTGTVQADRYSSDGAKQIVVENLELPPAEANVAHVMPTTAKDLDQYEKLLQQLIAGVEKDHFKKLLNQIFAGLTKKKFLKNPAAMTHHHAYLGGLLEHSVDVATLAKKIAANYPAIDLDLVVSGALLHDIGKIEEISPQVGCEYTLSGRFIGHIALGSMLVEKTIGKIENFPPEERLELIHILLSHHGCLENGSPVAPATKEALIVHYADEIDSTLNQLQQLAKGDKAEWQYSKTLARYVRVK
ncbi:MAG: HD domain-containing protein [Sporomusaceae bacterium]|jgi:3'-5' exoribonuclease|nr:HD domain-containing protein [Sporomusaceae bacterium]